MWGLQIGGSTATMTWTAGPAHQHGHMSSRSANDQSRYVDQSDHLIVNAPLSFRKDEAADTQLARSTPGQRRKETFVVTNSDGSTGRSDPGTGLLEKLAERLQAEGWYARVIASEGQTALLRVVNPLAPPLNDDLALRQDQARLWWFCWSFGDRIAHVDNLDIAVTRIIQVLGYPER
jgi:hypothetical protein